MKTLFNRQSQAGGLVVEDHRRDAKGRFFIQNAVKGLFDSFLQRLKPVPTPILPAKGEIPMYFGDL